MAQVISEVSGVLLAGGRSRRFGSDKAFAPWKGKKLVEAPAGILKDLFARNFLVSKEPEKFRFLEDARLTLIEDRSHDHHPLWGLDSALAVSQESFNFVAACDMPDLREDFLRYLCGLREGYDAVVPLWDKTPQPLCALYAKTCGPVVRDLLGEESPPLHDLFKRVRTRFVPEAAWRPFDPGGRSFIDIDTLEDFRAAAATV